MPEKMMIETKRKATILQRWRQSEYNCIPINLIGSQMQQPGLPDTLVMHQGLHIWIEFKNPETPIRTIQKLIHAKMMKQGIQVWLVRFMSESEWCIENVPLSINASQLSEACKRLFDTLVTLQRNFDKVERERSVWYFPMESAPAIGGTS